jgi:hypothetical protein
MDGPNGPRSLHHFNYFSGGNLVLLLINCSQNLVIHISPSAPPFTFTTHTAFSYIHSYRSENRGMAKIFVGIMIPYRHQQCADTIDDGPCSETTELSFVLCDICGEEVTGWRLDHELTTCSPMCNKKKRGIRMFQIIEKERNLCGIRPVSFWCLFRKECFKRDNYTCPKCGVSDIQKFFDYTDKGILHICFVLHRKLHAHHIIPIKKGGDNTLDNLITLCEDCHKKEHSRIENIKRKHIPLDHWS